jgi:hypothetical protein
MENTQSDKTNDMRVMITAVENYIYERKGVRVQIVFNNMTRFPAHFEMLLKAYEIAVNYKNTK